MIFALKIKYWDEFTEEEKEAGIFVFAESFPKAIKECENYFGERNILTAELEPMSPDKLMVFDLGERMGGTLFDSVKTMMKDTVIW